MARIFDRIARNNRILPRRLQFSREGKYYILFTFGIGFAAINTGNNLLYLLLGMLLAMIIFSGVLSEIAIRNVRPRRLEIPELFAGRESLCRLGLTNISPRMPAYSISVSEFMEAKAAKQVTQQAQPVMYIPRKTDHDLYLGLTFKKRGVYTSTGINVETEFPFAFFRKLRYFPEQVEFIVFPELLEEEPGEGPPQRVDDEDRHRNEAGKGVDIYGLREYRPGEPLTRISWKHTAKRGRLVLKEFEDLFSRDISILLVNHGNTEAEVEELISRTATFCETVITDYGRIRLVTLDSLLDGPAEVTGRRSILTHLARLQVHLSSPAAVARARRYLGSGRGWLVVGSLEAPEPSLFDSRGAVHQDAPRSRWRRLFTRRS